MPEAQDAICGALRTELGELGRLDRAQARTMPPSYYTSESFLDLEKEALFRGDWVCIGHQGEVPEPGDFVATEVADEQLVMLRDAGGILRVLSNVCRHRGNMLVEGTGNRRALVCQYHAWTYDLDGRLKTAPLMSGVEGFDIKACALPEFRSEIWNGFVFVNLDGNAAPLAPQLAELEPLVKNYHPEMRKLVFLEETVWETNWKNLAENFMEGYHIASTHPRTLQPITPTALCRKLPGGAAWTGYRSYYDPSIGERGPYHPDLTDDEKRNTVMLQVFPSLVIAVATHFTLFMCLRPAAADKVAIRWGVAGFVEDPQAPVVRDYVALCNAFNAEDRAKLETLQRAQRTRYMPGGRLAPEDFEGTIWDFLGYMSRRLGTAAEA